MRVAIWCQLIRLLTVRLFANFHNVCRSMSVVMAFRLSVEVRVLFFLLLLLLLRLAMLNNSKRCSAGLSPFVFVLFACSVQ